MLPETAFADHNSYMSYLRDWFAGQADDSTIDPFRTFDNNFGRSNTDAQARYAYADTMLAARSAGAVDETAMQHVAYFDEGAFHWMSGIRPRNCELYATPVQS